MRVSFWLLNSLALSLIVIGTKYPIPPNFTIFKAPWKNNAWPPWWLLASLPSSFGVWSPPTGRSTAPPPAAETVRSTGRFVGSTQGVWWWNAHAISRCQAMSSLASDSANCSVFVDDVWSIKCGALQSSVLAGWSFNDLKEESHSFMISAHPLAHEATQVW